MANNKTETKIATPLPKKNPQQNNLAQKKSVIRPSMTFFLLLIALILSIGSLYYSYTVQQKLLDEPLQMTHQLDQLKEAQNKSQENIDSKLEKYEQNQQIAQEKLTQTNLDLAELRKNQTSQKEDWQLIKVRYYLERAQFNAYWDRDPSAAIALLTQADQLLEKRQAPEIFELRQAIAKEINLLKAIPILDIAGLLSQLDAAQQSVYALKPPTIIKEAVTPQDSAADTTKNGHTELSKSLSLLKKLVVIRRDDEAIKPMMSPLFEAVVKEHIALNLQAAQWAILHDNPQVYQLSLQQAITHLKKTFNEQSQDCAALIKQLSTLQNIQTTQEKIKIDWALPLLNQLINRTKDAPVQEQGE